MPALPWWTQVSAPIGVAVVAFALTVAALALAVSLPLGNRRRWRRLHWTERARRAYSAKVTLLLGAIVLLFVLLSTAERHAGPLSLGGTNGMVAVALVATLVGALVAHFRLERVLRARPPTFPEWSRSFAIMGLLLIPNWLIGVGAAVLAPPRLDWRLAVVVCVTALALAAAALDWTLGLLRLLGWARRAGPRMQAAAAAAARRLDMPTPELYELKWHVAQGVALVEKQAVLVTEATLATLDDDELEDLCAHELAHLLEPPAVRRRRLLAYAIPLPLVAVKALGAHEWWAPLALFALVGLLAAMFRGWSREQESRADARVVGPGGLSGSYPRGLEKLYEANLTPAVFGHKTLTHPELYDRMTAAGVQPGFDRPLPPSRGHMVLGIATGGVLVAVVLPLLEMGVATAVEESRPENDVLWAAAAYGGNSARLLALASRRLGANEVDAALGIVRAIPADDPQQPEVAAFVATARARAGDCAVAQTELDDAVARHRQAGQDDDGCWRMIGARSAVDTCRKQARGVSEGLLRGGSSQPAGTGSTEAAE